MKCQVLQQFGFFILMTYQTLWVIKCQTNRMIVNLIALTGIRTRLLRCCISAYCPVHGDTHVFRRGPSMNTLNHDSIELSYYMFTRNIFGCAHSVMVYVVRNGHVDTSSNPGRSGLHFLLRKYPWGKVWTNFVFSDSDICLWTFYDFTYPYHGYVTSGFILFAKILLQKRLDFELAAQHFSFFATWERHVFVLPVYVK